MKNKLFSLLLVLAIFAGVFSGICLVASAETGVSPNLLEMYGYNPSFNDGILPWTVGVTGDILEQYDGDSQDDDGYCIMVSNRKQKYSMPRITGNQGLDLFLEQGAGTYVYSFWVKCATKNSTCTIAPTFQLCYGGKYSASAQSSGAVIGKWLGTTVTQVTVTDKEWTKVEVELEVATEMQGKELGQAIIYSQQIDFSAEHAPNMLVDNVSLVKKTGGWTLVTPEPQVSIPSQTNVDAVNRTEKTAIGAVYYHMWYETVENWWTYSNKELNELGRNSGQELRALSVKKYRYHLPFFATINETVSTKEFPDGVAELPAYTVETWTKEMNYAMDAGIDFMAYLWNDKGRIGEGAYKLHMETKGLDGKIKMCAILQRDTQNLTLLANAAVEDYWYTIDGMPVVYIFGGKDTATEEFITEIRRKIAVAQYVKNGEVGKPAYIISMGLNTYQTAVGVSSRGIDAAGWYAFSASGAATDKMKEDWINQGAVIKVVPYSLLTEYAMRVMTNVSKVAKDNYMSVAPCITLGYNTVPRIERPVTWLSGSTYSTGIPYDGYSCADPTPEEITKHVLDVLNFNKENAKYFRANTVLIYAWNEFNEGGWFCPTIKVDSEGNAIKNADGTIQTNTEYLDAVKKGISLYRQNETEGAIYDENGDKIKDVELAVPTQAPQKTAKPSQTATPDANNPDADQADKEEQANNGNGWVLWAIIGGAVVVAAAAAVVVVIILKKKKAAKQTEKAE